MTQETKHTPGPLDRIKAHLPKYGEFENGFQSEADLKVVDELLEALELALPWINGIFPYNEKDQEYIEMRNKLISARDKARGQA